MEPQSKEFLLAEHQYFREAFWRNEEVGDKRLTFLIGLVTAVMGGLVALAGKGSQVSLDNMRRLAIAASAALLVFGIATLLRIVQRNKVADEYKAALDRIRDHFRKQDRELFSYAPFPAGQRRRLVTGGILEAVMLVNSVVAAVLATLITLSRQPAQTVAIALGTLVVAFGLQMAGLSRGRRSAATQLAHLEMRWIFDGPLPDDVQQWFMRTGAPLGNNLSPAENREDIYFLADPWPDLGLKLSRGKLELKRRGVSEAISISSAGVSGRAEFWEKKGEWAYKDEPPDEVEAAFAPGDLAGSRISSRKQRRQRKYHVEVGRPPEAVDFEERPDRVLILELVAMEVAGHSAWSMLAEVIAPEHETRKLLAESLPVLLAAYPGPPLSTASSCSYPEWLIRTRSAAATTLQRRQTAGTP